MTLIPRVEHELLLSCAPTRAMARCAARVQAILRGNVDWEYLVSLAIRHGVEPLLWHMLSTLAPRDVPVEVSQQLSGRVAASAMYSHLLAQRLGELVHVMETDRIRALAFKGPTLAVLAYGDLSLRVFQDLDLVVHRNDFDHARCLLARQGYQLAADYGWEATYIGGSGVSIDIHQAMTPDVFPVPVDFDGWWRRRQVVEMDGVVAPTLSFEDLLLVLAIQVARDSWDAKLRLAKLCDIAQLVTATDELDWRAVRREATRLHVYGMLVFAVHLAAALLDMSVLEHAAQLTTPSRSARVLVSQERARLFDDPGERDPTRFRGAAFHYHVRERLRDKLWPFWVNGVPIAPNEQDRAVVRLPRPLAPLYYLIRPIRLAKRYLRGGGRHVH
jgi:hypothetical protein